MSDKVEAEPQPSSCCSHIEIKLFSFIIKGDTIRQDVMSIKGGFNLIAHLQEQLLLQFHEPLHKGFFCFYNAD